MKLNSWAGYFLVCYLCCAILFVMCLGLYEHKRVEVEELEAALFRCEHNLEHYKRMAGEYFNQTCPVPVVPK